MLRKKATRNRLITITVIIFDVLPTAHFTQALTARQFTNKLLTPRSGKKTQNYVALPLWHRWKKYATRNFQLNRGVCTTFLLKSQPNDLIQVTTNKNVCHDLLKNGICGVFPLC